MAAASVKEREEPRWYIVPPGWEPTTAILGVAHKGRPMMVGMLMRHVDGGLVFFHGHSDSQAYHALGISAPLDTCILALLREAGIARIYDFLDVAAVRDGRRGILRRATVELFDREGASLNSDGRARVGLVDARWTGVDVIERWRTNRVTRLRERVYTAERGEVFVAPWVTGPHYAVPPRGVF